MRTDTPLQSINKTTAALIAAGTLATGTALAFETETVAFASQGDELKGTLYLPDGASSKAPVPGIVITGAWTTVKEQMPTDYAEALAERGYATLIFDFAGWGASEGEPRFVEDPVRKTADILAAAAFLAEDTRIDGIGGLGICASSGYMVAAGIESPHIRSVALVAPWLHDAEIVDEVYGGAESVAALIATSRDAEAAAEAGTPQVVPAAGTAEEGAIMTQAPYYVDPEAGAIPAYDNKFSLASWEPWLTFDAITLAERFTKPLLLVHSEAAAIPQGAKTFEEKGGENVQSVWFEETTQFDFYDQPESVGKAADAVSEHFQNSLTANPDQAALHTLIESIAVLADRGEFEALAEAFAPEVTVDYTAAFGGEVEVVSRETLMERWAGLLPGFDRTRHALSDVSVQITDRTATCTASIVADHWLGSAHWQIAGEYRYEFTKDGNDWTVNGLTLTPTSETGSRDILAAAAQRAGDSPHPILRRIANRATIRTFLESLEQKDMEAFASVWADDAVQEMPYAPENFPERVEGKEALLQHYAAWPEISGEADFTSKLRFHRMGDASRLFVEYAGEVEILPTGRTYRQTYGGLFEFDEKGHITLFREYFNPVPFVWAFDLAETNTLGGR